MQEGLARVARLHADKFSQLILEKVDNGAFTRVESHNYNYVPLRELHLETFNKRLKTPQEIASWLEMDIPDDTDPDQWVEERLEELCFEVSDAIRCDEIGGNVHFEFDEDDDYLYFSYIFADE